MKKLCTNKSKITSIFWPLQLAELVYKQVKNFASESITTSDLNCIDMKNKQYNQL